MKVYENIYNFRGGFRVQKKVVTNFCKIDTIYIKVIAPIFVVIVFVIIIISSMVTGYFRLQHDICQCW